MATESLKVAGALPAAGIGVLNWIYTIFILNRFRGVCNFTQSEMVALLLFLYAAYAAWIAELCILENNLVTLQLIASFFRTLLNWLGMLLIVNEELYTSRQQIGSLLFVAVIAFLWEVQHRFMLQ